MLETRHCPVLEKLQEAFRKVHKNVVLEAKEVEGAKGKGKQPRADDIDDGDQSNRNIALYHLCKEMFLQQNYAKHFLNTL